MSFIVTLNALRPPKSDIAAAVTLKIATLFIDCTILSLIASTDDSPDSPIVSPAVVTSLSKVKSIIVP